MSLESLINDRTGTLQAQTITPDSSGGKVPSWADVSGAVSVGIRVQDAKTEVKKAYATKQIVITNTVITQEERGRLGDRWLDSDGVTYYLIRGIRTRRGIGGIDTFYLYDTMEARL